MASARGCRSTALASLLPPTQATRALTTPGSEDDTMAEFTVDIAAAGLVLLHRAGKEAPAKLLKAARVRG